MIYGSCGQYCTTTPQADNREKKNSTAADEVRNYRHSPENRSKWVKVVHDFVTVAFFHHIQTGGSQSYWGQEGQLLKGKFAEHQLQGYVPCELTPLR